VTAWCLSIILAVLTLVCGCERAVPPVSPPSGPATPAPAESPALVDSESAEGAAAVVRAYYGAINERRYAEAYHLWASSGAASGKSLAVFRDGFTHTTAVELELGAPGRIEGAAGSRYVEIPVRITAVAADGGRQPFAGSYTLRRSEVDGATAEQRAWRIRSANLQ